ncbi:ABC transporter permease [Oceanobacillus polygoni]|uniref:ABC-2 type transport system permease protein n=1 Tax=Oceanobacillus polygoni TaxID=1235259 RepID=A0A9X1CHM8_9BACI|nr:ABC transporter permease subunit [Oceanobacillus polygoni]MBP2078013.1 ABC-2 type transport system permease protein [Oceanobacillus polygoni]
MSNFFKLISNELTKIFVVKSTWIMYILLAVIIIGVGILNNTVGDIEKSYEADTWRTELEEENARLTQEMEDESYLESYNSMVIEENNYYLENDIQPSGYGAWHFILENQMLLSLVSLLTIIVAAGIVANEFRWGTIKLLLIRPISRTKILISKYVSVLLFALFTLIFVLIFSGIVGAILFGVEGMNPYTVLEKSGGLEFVSVIGEIISGYGYQMIILVMMATFAFMISSVFRNSALAIGLAIFLMFVGNQIVFFFAERSWAKYILFANTDLSQYADGNTPWIEGMTLGFSITMLLIYYIVFMLLAWIFFTKRDVAGN